MTLVRTADFEGGALTGADAADSSTGASIAITTTSPLKHTYSVDVPNVGSNSIRFNVTAADTLYVSTYVRVDTLPAGATRAIQILNTLGTTRAGFVISFTGANILLRVQDGTTNVGSTQALATGVGDIIRIALRYTNGTGTNGIVEGFYALGNAAFGAAFGGSTTTAQTDQVSGVNVGSTNATALDAVFDAIQIDDASLPGPWDIFTPTSLVVSDFADCMATVVASGTNDDGGDTTAAFERSNNGTTWTALTDTVTYSGTTSRTATMIASGLPLDQAATYFRVTWTNSGGSISGSATMYVGGGASPGTSTVLLTRKLHGQNRGLYPGAMPAWFSTAPVASTSNDTAVTIDGVEYLSWMKGEDNTMLSTIIGDGYTDAVGDQRLCLQVKVSGSATADPITLVTATNTHCWDATATAAFQAAIRADETMLLHVTSATAANRLNSGSGGYVLLNPGHATVQAQVVTSIKRRHMAVAANSVTAAQRRHDVHFDNVDASSTARGYGTPFEYSPGGFSNAWSNAMIGLVDAVTATGVRMTGNGTGSDAATTAVDGSTRRDLSDKIYVHLDMVYIEWAFGPYPSQVDATYQISRVSTGDAANSGIDAYWEPVDFDKYVTWLQIMVGDHAPGAGGFTYPSDFLVLGIGQLFDDNRNDTVAPLAPRYGWGMWMLTRPNDGTKRVYHRQADSSNSGYDRLRKVTALWNLVTGDPIEICQTDANSGNAAIAGSTTTKRARYRRFANGCVVMNVSNEAAVPYDLSALGYGTGTLAAFEVLWIAAPTGKPMYAYAQQ